MKSFIFAMLGLVIGGASGYYASFAITKKKYIKLADEEVESVKKSLKEYYESRGTIATKKQECTLEHDKDTESVQDIIDKNSIDIERLKKNTEQDSYEKYAKKYQSSATKVKKVKKEEPVSESVQENNYIYPLSPDEFADSELDVSTLNYYSDGVLADDDYNIIKDINGTIGSEALSIFDNHNKDVVYIRNEKLGVDYEILRNYENFYDVAPVPANTFPGEDD